MQRKQTIAFSIVSTSFAPQGFTKTTVPSTSRVRRGTSRRVAQTSSHRILGAYPTIPRSGDNKDAVIASISLMRKPRKEGRFRAYFGAIDVSGKAGPSHDLGALRGCGEQRRRYRAPHGLLIQGVDGGAVGPAALRLRESNLKP